MLFCLFMLLVYMYIFLISRRYLWYINLINKSIRWERSFINEKKWCVRLIIKIFCVVVLLFVVCWMLVFWWEICLVFEVCVVFVIVVYVLWFFLKGYLMIDFIVYVFYKRDICKEFIKVLCCLKCLVFNVCLRRIGSDYFYIVIYEMD